MKHLVAILIVILARSALGDTPQAEWYKHMPADDSITVNYVKLSGWGGDKDQNRLLLQQTYDACADIMKKLGYHVEPLPPGGIPQLVNPMNWEIYYGTDRVLIVDTGTIHYIDRTNCKLIESRRNNLMFRGPLGGCEVKLPVDGSSGGVALGACDQFTDRAVSRPRASVGAVNSLDSNKRHDPYRGIPGWIEPNFPYLTQTGERQTYAGLSCSTLESTVLPNKMCVAFPDVQGHPPTPRIESDGRLHGVLVAVENGAMHLKAVEAKMGLKTSPKLFTLPPGVTIRSIP